MRKLCTILLTVVLLVTLCVTGCLISCSDDRDTATDAPTQTTSSTQPATGPDSEAGSSADSAPATDPATDPATEEKTANAATDPGVEPTTDNETSSGVESVTATGTPSETSSETEPATETASDVESDTHTETETLIETAPATEAETETETISSTGTETETETETEKETITLDIQAASLNEVMASLYDGTIMKNETVMFLDAGEEKSLLFYADEILSVTSYDGKIVYEEGKDYELRDGKLVALTGGSMPVITSKVYYGADSSSLLQTKYNGKNVYTYWGESNLMTKWQVNVTYKHSDTWEGFRQTCELDQFHDLIRKFQNGEDVTVFFYGDSITVGANASFFLNQEPQQYSYPLLFTEALADLFHYDITYVSTGLSGNGRIPSKDKTVENARGTITYINTAVGGWTTQNGLDNYNTYVKPLIEEYGCDLFVLAFGMNDAGTAPRTVATTQEKILNKVLEQAADTSILIVSTMVPNPDATNGWYGNQKDHEKSLRTKVTAFQEKGVPCALVCMTSTSKAILEHKNFHDYTGNNINHPNDFFSRVYAQCLLQTLIGYENLK